MFEFAFIICSMMAVFGGLALIGDKVIRYWLKKKGVSNDEY